MMSEDDVVVVLGVNSVKLCLVFHIRPDLTLIPYDLPLVVAK